MEHSLPSLELSRPWRRATIVACAVAALEAALIVALLVVLVGRPVAERLEQQAAAASAPGATAPTPKPGAKKPVQAPPLPRTETAVLVLNGNGRAGAAGATGTQLKERGYVVAAVGNAPRTDYRRTYVMYRPGKQREAQRLAQDLGRGVVAPLDGIKQADLMGAHVALVLGP